MGGNLYFRIIRPLLGDHLRPHARYHQRHTETGGAVIVMSIIGGAVIPVIQGFVSDHTGSMQTAFVVSLLCFAAVLVYFISARRWELNK